MSKVSAGGGKQGKSGKSRSKGSGADIVSSRTESLATSRNTGVVTLLRKALRNDDGTETVGAMLDGCAEIFQHVGLAYSP